jgi:hypothetical protein
MNIVFCVFASKVITFHHKLEVFYAIYIISKQIYIISVDQQVMCPI